MTIKKEFFSINSKKMCVWDCGDEKALPVLLGHSFLWNKAMWEPQIEILSQHYRLIIPDLWAHGESDNLPKSSYTINDLADDYWQLMQQLNIEKFVILGLSVGGMWGVQLAIDHPQNVIGLGLLGTYVGAEPAVTHKKYFELLDRIDKIGFTEEVINILWPYFFSHKVAEESVLVKNFKTDLIKIPRANVSDIVAIGKMIFTRKSNLENLSNLKMPICIIVGKDDGPRPPREAEEMAKYVNCELIIVDDAGHISNKERPQELTQHLQDFLKKIDPIQFLEDVPSPWHLSLSS